jgi:hypothetical protein
MYKIVLGTALACLFATSSFATGFEFPRLPDFSLQRDAATYAGVDSSIKTGSISSDDRGTGKPAKHETDQMKRKHRVLPQQ